MAYEVIISDPAFADLDNAVGYIAATLGAPRAAASLVDDFESTIRLLAEDPLLFGVDFFVSEAIEMQVRRCPVKRYGAYYIVDETARKVFVVAFVHTLRSVSEIISVRM